jgi:hypothetical protein
MRNEDAERGCGAWETGPHTGARENIGVAISQTRPKEAEEAGQGLGKGNTRHAAVGVENDIVIRVCDLVLKQKPDWIADCSLESGIGLRGNSCSAELV